MVGTLMRVPGTKRCGCAANMAPSWMKTLSLSCAPARSGACGVLALKMTRPCA